MIKVDDREDGDMMLMLNELGAEFVVERLKVGDYVSGDVCIERKTIDDFCGSICDGRLKKQVTMMKEGYGRCFVMVSGGIKSRKCEVHEHVILAVIASIAVRFGVCVLMFDNDYQLCYCLMKIMEKYESEEEKMLEGGVKNGKS